MVLYQGGSLRPAEVWIHVEMKPKGLPVEAMSICDTLNDIFEALPMKFVPQYSTCGQWARMRENPSAQEFVLVDTIIDRHSEAREHDADEPRTSVLARFGC